MKKFIILLASVSVVFFTQSCAVFTLADANTLQKGMAPTEVLNQVSKGPRETLVNASKNLEVQVFQIVVGNYKADYFAAYKGGKLLYWGYPYEFARHNNPEIVEMGAWAVDELKRL
ncbi:MAG: hypothetical protein U0Y96_14485 [Candidatus Kapaibacterium sp.]|nr:hypothetical protein [Bacteroidota bacterium]